jgi:flagellar biosynthesis protein
MPDQPPDPQQPRPPREHRRRATALSYEPGARGGRAPIITATGSGLIAERIIATAREAGIPVREDPALSEALAKLELGREVPQELWRAAAEALAWAYKLDAHAAGS